MRNLNKCYIFSFFGRDEWDIGKVIWRDISEILLSLSVLRVSVWLTRGRCWGRLLIRWPQGQGQRHGASSITRWCHNYTPNRVLQMDWGDLQGAPCLKVSLNEELLHLSFAWMCKRNVQTGCIGYINIAAMRMMRIVNVLQFIKMSPVNVIRLSLSLGAWWPEGRSSFSVSRFLPSCTWSACQMAVNRKDGYRGDLSLWWF